MKDLLLPQNEILSGILTLFLKDIQPAQRQCLCWTVSPPLPTFRARWPSRPASMPQRVLLAAPPSPGDPAFRDVIALGNLHLVITCLFAFCCIFLLTKYGYFLPSTGTERQEERI